MWNNFFLSLYKSVFSSTEPIPFSFLCFHLLALFCLLCFLRVGIMCLFFLWLGLKPAFVLLSQAALPKVHFNHHLEQPSPSWLLALRSVALRC